MFRTQSLSLHSFVQSLVCADFALLRNAVLLRHLRLARRKKKLRSLLSQRRSAPVGTPPPHHPVRGSPAILLRPCHLSCSAEALFLSRAQDCSHLTEPLCVQDADIDICQYLLVRASCMARQGQQNSKKPAPHKQTSSHLKSIRPAHPMQRRCSRHLPHGVQRRSGRWLSVSNYDWTMQGRDTCPSIQFADIFPRRT